MGVNLSTAHELHLNQNGHLILVFKSNTPECVLYCTTAVFRTCLLRTIVTMYLRYAVACCNGAICIMCAHREGLSPLSLDVRTTVLGGDG